MNVIKYWLWWVSYNESCCDKSSFRFHDNDNNNDDDDVALLLNSVIFNLYRLLLVSDEYDTITNNRLFTLLQYFERIHSCW